MPYVKFKSQHPNRNFVLIFEDENGCEYLLDENINVINLTRQFYDDFYFCEKILVRYKTINKEKIITEIVNYKRNGKKIIP